MAENREPPLATDTLEATGIRSPVEETLDCYRLAIKAKSETSIVEHRKTIGHLMDNLIMDLDLVNREAVAGLEEREEALG